MTLDNAYSTQGCYSCHLGEHPFTPRVWRQQFSPLSGNQHILSNPTASHFLQWRRLVLARLHQAPVIFFTRLLTVIFFHSSMYNPPCYRHTLYHRPGNRLGTGQCHTERAIQLCTVAAPCIFNIHMKNIKVPCKTSTFYISKIDELCKIKLLPLFMHSSIYS